MLDEKFKEEIIRLVHIDETPLNMIHEMDTFKDNNISKKDILKTYYSMSTIEKNDILKTLKIFDLLLSLDVSKVKDSEKLDAIVKLINKAVDVEKIIEKIK